MAKAPNQPAAPAAPVVRTGDGELAGKLRGLSLPRQVWVLSIWPLLEQIMNFLVGLVDMILAANLKPVTLGEAATDALGIGVYLMWFMSLVHGAVGTGAGALIARAIGARHKRLANAGLGQALTLSLTAGTVIGGTIFAVAPQLASLLGLDGQALELCTIYLRVLACAAPFSAVLFVAMGCWRSSGDARTPFNVMLLVNATNIGISCLLVYGPAPVGGHGVTGIALGTVAAWVVGGVAMMSVVVRGNEQMRFRWVRLRPHWHTIKRITKIATPNFAEMMTLWGTNAAILWMIGLMDTPGIIGSHAMAIRIEAMGFMPGFALGTAAAVLTGQYLGAGNPRRAKQAIALCLGAGVVFMTLMGVVFFTLPHVLTGIISDVPLHMEVVPKLLRICALSQPFFALAIIISLALRGAGDTRTTLILSTVSLLGYRLPMVYFFGLYLGWGIEGVWMALVSEWVLRGGLMLGRLVHGGWTNVKV